MNRREFIHRTAYSAGAAWLHSAVFARLAFAFPSLSRKFNAADTVTLGKTGIQTSRLAMGTGTVGGTRCLHLGLLRPATRSPDGTLRASCGHGRPDFPALSVHLARGIRLYRADGLSNRRAAGPRPNVRRQ